MEGINLGMRKFLKAENVPYIDLEQDQYFSQLYDATHPELERDLRDPLPGEETGQITPLSWLVKQPTKSDVVVVE